MTSSCSSVSSRNPFETHKTPHHIRNTTQHNHKTPHQTRFQVVLPCSAYPWMPSTAREECGGRNETVATSKWLEQRDPLRPNKKHREFKDTFEHRRFRGHLLKQARRQEGTRGQRGPRTTVSGAHRGKCLLASGASYKRLTRAQRCSPASRGQPREALAEGSRDHVEGGRSLDSGRCVPRERNDEARPRDSAGRVAGRHGTLGEQ